MKHFGFEPTNLILSKDAQSIYDDTDPIDIYEADDGTYSIRGAIEADGLTAAEVNSALIALAAE